MSYFDYVKENIFDKTSMKNTFFYSMDEINDDAAEGYEAIEDDNENIVDWKKNIYSYPPKGAADASAYTTVNDMDIFLRALISNELLSKEMTDETLKPQVLHRKGEKRSIYMGYGFQFICRNRDNQVLCMYKDGSNAGVACEIEYYPEIDTTLTILSNTDACDVWELAFEVREQLGLVFE